MIHHGDEKIEQNDNIDDGEGTKHEHAPEPGELLDASQLKVVQINQTKYGPEQSLNGFPKATKRRFDYNSGYIYVVILKKYIQQICNFLALLFIFRTL